MDLQCSTGWHAVRAFGQMLLVQVKEQTLRERGQADLRLQEAHQAEQTALAHLHSMRKDCRYLSACICACCFCAHMLLHTRQERVLPFHSGALGIP